jgi:uncharacterized membrane protein YdcZ (DUF606 family)
MQYPLWQWTVGNLWSCIFFINLLLIDRLAVKRDDREKPLMNTWCSCILCLGTFQHNCTKKKGQFPFSFIYILSVRHAKLQNRDPKNREHGKMTWTSGGWGDAGVETDISLFQQNCSLPTGNSMVSSAIWKINARVSFSKRFKIA